MENYYQNVVNNGQCLCINQYVNPLPSQGSCPTTNYESMGQKMVQAMNKDTIPTQTPTTEKLKRGNSSKEVTEKKTKLEDLDKSEKKLMYNRLIETCIELLESIYKLTNGRHCLPCTKTERLNFIIFLENTIKRARISIPIFITIMFYIQRLRFKIQKNPSLLKIYEGLAIYDRSDLRKIYLVATILAFKFLNDRHIHTIVWAKYAEYTVNELNRGERHFLKIIDYYLNITEKNYNCLLEEYIKKIVSISKYNKKSKEDNMDISSDTPSSSTTTSSSSSSSSNQTSSSMTSMMSTTTTTTTNTIATNYNTPMTSMPTNAIAAATPVSTPMNMMITNSTTPNSTPISMITPTLTPFYNRTNSNSSVSSLLNNVSNLANSMMNNYSSNYSSYTVSPVSANDYKYRNSNSSGVTYVNSNGSGSNNQNTYNSHGYSQITATPDSYSTTTTCMNSAAMNNRMMSVTRDAQMVSPNLSEATLTTPPSYPYQGTKPPMMMTMTPQQQQTTNLTISPACCQNYSVPNYY